VTEKKLAVPEVHCGHCVSSIEGAVGRLGGVHSVKVDLDGKQVAVSFDEETVPLDSIIQAIEEQGYDVGEPKPLEIGRRPD
jgi:copper chaperone